MDQVDIQLRKIYGSQFEKLNPVTKALITCLMNQDYTLSRTIYERCKDETLVGLKPLHADLIRVLCLDSKDVKTTWLSDLLSLWENSDLEKAAEVLNQNQKELDSMSISWLLRVKESKVKNRKIKQ